MNPTGVTKQGAPFVDALSCDQILFLVYYVNALPMVAWRPSGTALTLRVRPNTIEPELPFYRSFSVFYEPVVGEAEMVVSEEAVVGR